MPRATVDRMLLNAASHEIHAQVFFKAVMREAIDQRVKRVCALTEQHYSNLIAGALHDTVLYHRGDCVTGEINVVIHCDTTVDEKDARFLARCHSASPVGLKGGVGSSVSRDDRGAYRSGGRNPGAIWPKISKRPSA
jgi:hypothetical protein